MKLRFSVYLFFIIMSFMHTITCLNLFSDIPDPIAKRAHKEGKKSIRNFSEVLHHGSDLRLSEKIMTELENLSVEDQKTVISMINDSLKNIQTVSNVLDLSRQIKVSTERKENLEFQQQARIFRNYLDNRFVHAKGSLESGLHDPFGGGDYA